MHTLCKTIISIERDIEKVRRYVSMRDEDEYVELMDHIYREDNIIGIDISHMVSYMKYVWYNMQ